MLLSKESVEALSDLIEVRLSMMTVSDQDDLREQLKLRRALVELQKDAGAGGLLAPTGSIPRRGRRRKIAGTAVAIMPDADIIDAVEIRA